MHFKWSRAVLSSCMIIENWDILLPVRLFPPVHLLVFRKCSTLYVYSILYDYLVLKSTLSAVLLGVELDIMSEKKQDGP